MGILLSDREQKALIYLHDKAIKQKAIEKGLLGKMATDNAIITTSMTGKELGDKGVLPSTPAWNVLKGMENKGLLISAKAGSLRDSYILRDNIAYLFAKAIAKDKGLRKEYYEKLKGPQKKIVSNIIKHIPLPRARKYIFTELGLATASCLAQIKSFRRPA